MAALRADIAAATGCTASAGIGPNLLLARLATRRAKPDGQLRVTVEQARPRPGRARGSDPAGQAACCRAARSRITHPRCTGDQPCAGSWAGVPPPGAAGIGAVQPNPALPCMNPKYTQADVAAGLGGRRPARHGASHAREAGRGSPQPYSKPERPQADVLLLGLAADDLPGVGYATREKLDALGIRSVADVRARPRQALQRELGAKTGASVRPASMSKDCSCWRLLSMRCYYNVFQAWTGACTFSRHVVGVVSGLQKKESPCLPMHSMY